MSEKVKLTRKQAEAIEAKKGNGSAAVAKHLEGWTWKENKCLNDLSMERFVKALYIGYEIEETFEVGDWVKDTSTNAVIKINDRQHRNNLIDPRHTTIRHATPEEIAEEKQRRWWAKHGRGVWELREGDCLISRHDRHTCQVKFVEASDKVGVLLVDGIQDEFYEGEHDLEIMKDRYVVFCFAEDRKDINGGDSE